MTSTAQLLECFRDEKIYYREITNEYCGPSCSVCANHPWLLVTTRAGHFKLGWRKRVIHLDWSDSDIVVSGEDLFTEEDTTKSRNWEKERYVHAWGYEKLTEYLKKLHELTPRTK